MSRFSSCSIPLTRIRTFAEGAPLSAVRAAPGEIDGRPTLANKGTEVSKFRRVMGGTGLSRVGLGVVCSGGPAPPGEPPVLRNQKHAP